MSRVHIDYFSTSLEDLPRKQKSDPVVVYDTIVRNGRFSCFEIDSNLASAVTLLFQRKYLRDTGAGYPWTTCEPTEAGNMWRETERAKAKNGGAG